MVKNLRVEWSYKVTELHDANDSEEQAIAVACFERALDFVGWTGKEVLYENLRDRYGVTKKDIMKSPGRFMSALKLMLDSSALVLERYVLDELDCQVGMWASSFEEAVAFLNALEAGKTLRSE